MDLKNNRITLAELLADPRSRGVLQRRFGKLLSHPLLPMAMGMTLSQLSMKAAGKLPRQDILDTIRELKEL